MIKKIIKKIKPIMVLSWYHFFLSFLSALRYGFPSKKMMVIGITGTNGKSTTIDFAHLVLEKTNKNVASASSIRFKIGEEYEENKLKMTMPGRFYLQRFLKKALKRGCKYVIVEVTSEGVLQHRHRFIDFDIAIFTNLSKEHIVFKKLFPKNKNQNNFPRVYYLVPSSTLHLKNKKILISMKLKKNTM